MEVSNQPDLGDWHAAHPAEAAVLLSDLKVPWWIAGGWALDLFAGDQSRPHGDLDVGVLRRDIEKVVATLCSWQIFEAKDGTLTQLLAARQPRLDVSSLWCRPNGEKLWMLELMLDESIDDDWVFRRNPNIRRALAATVRRTSCGLPYLAPEIQLLYKAKHIRERDQSDFEYIAPRLDLDARAWLRQSLDRSDPGHPWIPMLSGADDIPILSRE